ncbi:sensor histidine kinase [Niabella insulamsoli]|uniref:sensor histidine kinase n=1 Tax=Niabella insulamsoli TaxID=3144874 RepID=UPI0031FCAD96
MIFSWPTLFAVGMLYSALGLGQTQDIFRRLGVNDGLSQNSVREIFQDRQGFIWIGTGDGLNRYDGRRIKKYRESFRSKSPKDFPGKIISGQMVEDDQQNLWMLVDGQVVRMHMPTETFTIIKKVGRDLECRILRLCGPQLFVSIPDAVTIINIHNLSSKTILLKNTFGIYQSGAEPALLFIKDYSVYSYHINSRHFTKLVQSRSAISNAAMGHPSSFLFLSANQIHEYHLTERKITASYPLPFDEATNKYVVPLRAAKTPQGNIIAAAISQGLIILDSARKTARVFQNTAHDPLSLSSNLIYTSLIDQSGNLWLGTEGGGVSILDLKPKLFNGFPQAAIANKESSLLMVKSIFFQEPHIYVGTYDKGLYEVNRFTGGHRKIFEAESQDASQFHGVFFIKKDSKGQVWMNIGPKVGFVDFKKQQFIKSVYVEYTRKGRSHNIVQCFEQIGDHKYIVGTFYSTYLLEYDGDEMKLTDLGLLDHRFEDDIQTIHLKENGDIMIGKGSGKGYIVARISDHHQCRVIESRFNNLTVKHIYRDTLRKAFWMATNVGLVIQKDSGEPLDIIDEKNGLSNDFIYGILPQDDYIFWVSTNKGLNRIQLDKSRGIVVKSVEKYDIQHGLQSNEFNTGAFFKWKHLHFFGGVTGINWFDERQFFYRSFKSRSYITEALINEKNLLSDTAINFLKTLRLHYDENNIAIRFAALDYTNPQVIQYQYRLKNYDKQWIDAGHTGEARYSKLPHGNYTFELKTGNHEGVWSQPASLLNISIAPPFWLTWWFKIGTLLFLSAAVYFAIRFYLKRRIEKQLRPIEKKLAVNNERLRISRDMHDELGTGLSKIALLSEVGKKSGTGDARIINEINATSRTLADKMGEIIWTLDPQNDTLGNLAAYLKEYIYETTEALPVSVSINFPETIPEATIGNFQRQQLMLVTKEALNNALKYARASEISFTFLMDGNKLIFYLRDNGVGFNCNTPLMPKGGKHNGLANMKNRMESIGGQLAIQSDNGTEICYSMEI